VPKSFQHPQKYFESNIIGTWNVLSKYSGGSTTIVNISSSSAKENLSPYAISKCAAEQCAALFKKTVSLRLFNVFGERQPDIGCIVPAFCKHMIARKQPIIYGDGTQSRDFTYVKDVVRVIADYGQHSCATGVHDIGYGQNITVMDMFKKIAKLTKFNGKPMQMSKRKGDIDYSRASEAMKQPKWGFDKGLERTVDYFKEVVANDKKLSSLKYSGKWRYGDG
jgi:nucleoside-diphosphate-sugar epimerase